MNTFLPSKTDLETTYKKIAPYVHNTPVLRSGILDEISGVHIVFKCENFQRTGAFKMRGAMYAMLQLSEEQRVMGVVTHSSGNFGQAVALAAKNLGVTAYIVMPLNATSVKVNAVKQYGGIIIRCKSTLEARELELKRIQKETGAIVLHPSNQIEVILGNATSAMELLKTNPTLDHILTPVGGGGLLAGTALATHYFGNNCTAIAGEPFEADDAYRSLLSGKIESNKSSNTIADGLRTNLGDINFPIIKTLVPEVIRVTEDEIIAALRLIWERMKIIVEPSSAVPLAALLSEREHFINKNVGIILSGGNVDISDLPF